MEKMRENQNEERLKIATIDNGILDLSKKEATDSSSNNDEGKFF
jgi:hypothetical protein